MKLLSLLNDPRRDRVLLVIVALICLLSVPTCQGCLVNGVAFHPEPGMARSPDDFAAPIQPLTLKTSDNVEISAFWLPRDSSPCSLIFFHGNAGNASHRFGAAVDLWNLGISVLLVDYRGYGLSEGRPSERGIYRDAVAARDYLVRNFQIDERRIVLYGRSLGSAAAVDLAGQGEFAGVVLATPLASGQEMARAMGFGPLAMLIGKPFDSVRKIKKLRSPLLVFHGTQDEVIPFEQGKKIYLEAPGEKELVTLVGADHNTFTQTHGAQFLGAFGKFLRKVCPVERDR